MNLSPLMMCFFTALSLIAISNAMSLYFLP